MTLLEKVPPYPIKCATPVSDNSTEELVKEMPEVFSSCVVTRSMAREQNKEDREYSLEDILRAEWTRSPKEVMMLWSDKCL